MTAPAPDQRSPRRRAHDEQVAAEPQLPPPDLPPGVAPSPVEARSDARVQRSRLQRALQAVLRHTVPPAKIAGKTLLLASPSPDDASLDEAARLLAGLGAV